VDGSTRKAQEKKNIYCDESYPYCRNLIKHTHNFIYFLAETTDFSLFSEVQIGSGTQPVSYSKVTSVYFASGKVART
jgi:hypothetical protein